MQHLIREQEVSDDEEEELFIAESISCMTHKSGIHTPKARDTNGSNSDEDLEHTVVWDSGHSNTQPANYQHDDESLQPIVVLKDTGNKLLKAGDYQGALDLYQQAINSITTVDTTNTRQQLSSILYSNAAAAYFNLSSYKQSLESAQKAHQLNPTWTRPLHRLAQCHLALGDYTAAINACKTGQKLPNCKPNSEGHTEFTPLWDRIAVEAYMNNKSLVGFDGAVLEVRSAGDDAWLGRPAPHNPLLDGPLTEENALHGDDLSAAVGSQPVTGLLLEEGGALSTTAGIGGVQDSLVNWNHNQLVSTSIKKRTSFRSIKEAVSAAVDGDVVLLRPGIHNGMGESTDIKKRLFIYGEGSLGDAVIDQRANCPTFRIMRSGVVLYGVDLDQTGFRESILVTSLASTAVHTLIDGCRVKCSGDDAINVSGTAAPVFKNCQITGKKCGVRSFDTAAPKLVDCMITECGEQGIKVMDASTVTLINCRIKSCQEEGVVAMDKASISVINSQITDNKGPGVDCSDTSRARIQGGSILKNVGGVWCWDESRAILSSHAVIEGGPSQVLLIDTTSTTTSVEATDCIIKGTVHASDDVWKSLLDSKAGNRLFNPEGPTDFPAEEGPFKFVPNQFTRKQ